MSDRDRECESRANNLQPDRGIPVGDALRCSRELDDVRFISGSNPLELSSVFQLQLMAYGHLASGEFVAPVTHRVCRFLLTRIRNVQPRSHLSPVLHARSQIASISKDDLI